MGWLDKLKCGQIVNNAESLFFRPKKPDVPPYDRKEVWTIASCNMNTSVHAVIQFANPRYKAVAILPGIDYCGKYFVVAEFVTSASSITKPRRLLGTTRACSP